MTSNVVTIAVTIVIIMVLSSITVILISKPTETTVATVHALNASKLNQSEYKFSNFTKPLEYAEYYISSPPI